MSKQIFIQEAKVAGRVCKLLSNTLVFHRDVSAQQHSAPNVPLHLLKGAEAGEEKHDFSVKSERVHSPNLTSSLIQKEYSTIVASHISSPDGISHLTSAYGRLSALEKK